MNAHFCPVTETMNEYLLDNLLDDNDDNCESGAVVSNDPAMPADAQVERYIC